MGDNCNLNKSICQKLNIPLVGCNRHRLNLAVNLVLEPHEDLLENINNIMKKLTTIKRRAYLNESTKLKLIIKMKQDGHPHSI